MDKAKRPRAGNTGAQPQAVLGLAGEVDAPSIAQPTNLVNLAWYCEQFIPPDAAHYALMQPEGISDKYRRRNQPPTAALIGHAFNTRVSLAVAVTPQSGDGYARAAILDIDKGGRPAVARALTVAASFGLWGFAQISAAGDHEGGHVYFPTAAPMPAALLQSLAARLQAAAAVEGEAYPSARDLRLPLMPHMRTEGGPRRLPLLLQTGELLDTSDPWQSLADLRAAWTPNTPEAMTRAAEVLPELTPSNRQPLHKSKVNPLHGPSVIKWYLENHTLGDVLGAIGAEPPARSGAIRCPWHDDRRPSLVVWTHPEGKRVCRCFSQHSNCPAAAAPFWDAFNILCHLEGLTDKEAVKSLSERYGLGERRTLRQTSTPQAPKMTPEAHAALIATRRAELASALDDAAMKQGAVTVLRAVMGLGKTYVASERADVWHAQGRAVAVVCPTKEHAASEWAAHLTAPYIWQSRKDLCTCYTREAIEEWERKGYAAPECKDGCPYRAQRDKRLGHVVIYQHNHLHLNGGELLRGADVVIVDESPANALLSENVATAGELGSLLKRLPDYDPARPVVAALVDVSRGRRERLYGPELLAALAERLGDVARAVDHALKSDRAPVHPVASEDSDPERLPRQFLGRLLTALAHDAHNPELSPLVEWGRNGDGHAWLWGEQNALLGRNAGQITRFAPAVIVLDGSGDEATARDLYAPWTTELVTIDAPLSPLVNVVHVTTGASTRHLVKEQDRIDNVARALAYVCNELGITLDGGVSYKGAAPRLGELLGGEWLHYGGQRGRNTLKNARALAIVASPTVPPDAIERKARALWSNAPAIDPTWQRLGKGYYSAVDPRLEAMNRLHVLEELRQAIHRARPILPKDEPVTLVVITPWSLEPLGITPDVVISELPHGKSTAAHDALDTYRARRHLSPVQADRGGECRQQTERQENFPIFKTEEDIETNSYSRFENQENYLSCGQPTQQPAPPYQPGLGEDDAPGLDLDTLDETFICAECGREADRYTPEGLPVCDPCHLTRRILADFTLAPLSLAAD